VKGSSVRLAGADFAQKDASAPIGATRTESWSLACNVGGLPRYAASGATGRAGPAIGDDHQPASKLRPARSPLLTKHTKTTLRTRSDEPASAQTPSPDAPPTTEPQLRRIQRVEHPIR
jgi:Leucine-rich repeat (LRR) protein